MTETKLKQQALKQPTLISPTLLNGFSQYSGWSKIGYYKDAAGIVHLQGLCAGGSSGNNVFVLPAGYRPATSLIFAVESADAICRCNVYSSGNVQFGAGFNSGWACLDGITFLAEN